MIRLVRGMNPDRNPPEGLNPDLWKSLVAAGLLRTLAHKQVLFEEGASVAAMAFVIRGLLTLSKENCVVDLAEMGQTIGGALMKSPDSPIYYPVTSMANGPADVLEIPYDLFCSLMDAQPSLRHFIQEQFQRRMFFIQKCRFLQNQSVQTRLAHVLLEKQRALRTGPITRELISRMAGTTPESTIRILSAWEKEGLVKFRNRRLIEVDQRALRSRCVNTK